jgi:hypothetical protein
MGSDQRKLLLLVLRLTGSLAWVFAALSAGLVLYGVLLAGMVASGAWFRRRWCTHVSATA